RRDRAAPARRRRRRGAATARRERPQPAPDAGGAAVRVVGMISGTSHDAIEAAAVDLDLAGDAIEARLVATASIPYAPELRARLVAALPPAETTLAEVCALDTLIGQAFADAAAALELDPPAELVCSHGQTVYHWVDGPRALGTLQL